MGTKESYVQRLLRSLAVAGLASAIILPTNPLGRAALVNAPGKSSNSVASLQHLELRTRMRGAHDVLPLTFEKNVGQSDSQTKFLARGQGHTFYFTDADTLLIAESSNDQDRLSTARGSRSLPRMKLLGASSQAEIVGVDESPGKSNYFIGDDPKRWLADVPTYAAISRRGVYPGIDVIYHGNRTEIEYDFVIAPGADAGLIKIATEGTESLRLAADGDLVLQTTNGEIRQHKPVVYQEVGGMHISISCRYLLEGNEVGFDLGNYDPCLPLVIDPVLSYSTYLGGSTRDEGNGIAVDSMGNVYVAGYTNSANFPMVTTSQVARGDCSPCGNVFVTKLNATGTASVYTTILGGSHAEVATGITVDSSGNAYVIGNTFSRDFPTTAGAFQKAQKGPTDVFVAKLNATGNGLIYSTFIGGSSDDGGSSIAVDSLGNASITGSTYSSDFPTTPDAFQSSRGAAEPSFSDAFVTKLNPEGTELIFSTYLSGRGNNRGTSIASDPSGNVYVTGKAGAGFPTTVGVFQPNLQGGNDAFVAKLSSPDGALVYSTYLGGSSGLPDGVPCAGCVGCCPFGEVGSGIAVDSVGNAYVTGGTSSDDFPSTAGAFRADLNSTSTLFVTKLNPGGTALIYSAMGIGGTAIALDSSGSAYVMGTTTLDTIPVLSAFQRRRKGGTDAYIAKLDSTGSTLVYASYLGGSEDDFGNAIAVDAYGNAYVTGNTVSVNFRTRNALQANYGGLSGGTGSEVGDAFVAKIALPRIIAASVRGRKLFVIGENFDEGAAILVDGQEQKTLNDEQTPDARLIGKKAGRKILPGQRVILQVRNSDSTLSAEFSFTRPLD